MRIIVAAVLLALIGFIAPSPALAARPTPVPSASPSPAPEDLSATKTARQLFVTWQIGLIDHKKYTDQLNQSATDDQVSDVSKQLVVLGALQSLEWLGYRRVDGLVDGTKIYLYRAHCQNGNVLLQFGVQPDGLIAGVVYADNLADLPGGWTQPG